jgi:hypothetical protein
MVHLDLNQENDARLSVVGDLAERFTARVIGVAAQAKPVYYTDDLDGARFVEADRGAMEDNLAEIRQRLQQAEERFRTALRGRAKQLEWRSSIEDPIPYIADQCRVADLLVIGTERTDQSNRFDRAHRPSAPPCPASRPDVAGTKNRRRLEGYARSPARGTRRLAAPEKISTCDRLQNRRGSRSWGRAAPYR